MCSSRRRERVVVRREEEEVEVEGSELTVVVFDADDKGERRAMRAGSGVDDIETLGRLAWEREEMEGMASTTTAQIAVSC